MKVTFEKGKAVIKNGRKIIAKIFDRAVFYKENKIKGSYSEKYPFSIELHCGIRECESLDECILYIKKYAF